MSTCSRCEGWGCRQCRPSTYSETDAPGVESHDIPKLLGRIASLEAQLEAAWLQVGLAWRREGTSLAEAIRAKCHLLEGVKS